MISVMIGPVVFAPRYRGCRVKRQGAGLKQALQ
jgi:hypothetical protein